MMAPGTSVVTLSLGLAASTAVFSNSSLRFIPRETFRRPPLLGRIDIDSPVRLYYVALAALALTILAVTGARRSRFGRALVAQRDNERAAQAYAVVATGEPAPLPTASSRAPSMPAATSRSRLS